VFGRNVPLQLSDFVSVAETVQQDVCARSCQGLRDTQADAIG